MQATEARVETGTTRSAELGTAKDAAIPYETIVVFSPDGGESKIQEEVRKVETLLRNAGAIKIKAETWGRKELSYLVKKKRFGFFVCFTYESPYSVTVKEVTSILRITDAVIKFQTHRKPTKVRKFKGNPRRTQSLDAGDDFMDGLDDIY